MNDKKGPSFADIQEEIQNILDTFEDGQETSPELDAYIDDLAAQESDKVDGFGQFLRMSEAQEDAFKAEADRLRRRAKTLENTRNYLKMRYLQTMEQHGLQKIKGQVYTLSRRATKVVQILDEKAIPADFLRVKTTIEPAKTDILASLKIGKPVPGCALGESYSLQVR